MNIQVDLALQRLGGNKALYVNLALRFPQDVVALLAAFRNHLANGKPGEAAASLHTLKGVAGSVGAYELAESASAFELQIKNTQQLSDDNAACRDLESLANQTLIALDATVAKLVPAPQNPANTGFERDELTTMLDELACLLETANMRALSVFAQMQYKFGTTALRASPGLRALADAMNNLDFESALENCRLLRSELE